MNLVPTDPWSAKSTQRIIMPGLTARCGYLIYGATPLNGVAYVDPLSYFGTPVGTIRSFDWLYIVYVTRDPDVVWDIS